MTFLSKKIVVAVLSIIYVLSLCSVPVLAEVNLDNIQNIMINADFEEKGTWFGKDNNRQYGWYSQGDTAGFNITNSRIPQSGSYCGETWGAEYEFYQYVPVEKNRVYVVSFWYQCVSSSGVPSNTALFKVYGADNVTVLSEKNYGTKTEWTQVVHCFNSGENEKVRVCVTNKGFGSNIQVLLDNFVMGICEPKAEDVCIDGYATVSNKLKAVADVSDPIGDTILETDYLWQISNNGSNSWSDIEDADEYTVKKSDMGKYIRVGAVPKSESLNGLVKKGTIAYSAPIKVSEDTENIPVSIDALFTGKLLGTLEEAQPVTEEADSINGYILNNSSIINTLDESNGYKLSDAAYSVSLYSDKRAVQSGSEDLVISLISQNLDSVNVLMAYSQIPQAEQKAVIDYSDGTSEDIAYTAGSIMEKTETAPLANSNPMGMFGVGENADDENAGFLYSYSFDIDEEKEVESITFPYASAEGKLLVFAVTGKQVTGEKLRQIIDDKIQALPETITLDDRSAVENIMSYAELYSANGGNPDEISGYSTVKMLLTDVQTHTPSSDLLECTIDVDFSNPVKSDSISKETITVAGLDKNQYEVVPVMSGDDVIGAKVTVINNFSYQQLEITLSDKIASAAEPYFDLGQSYIITYTPEKLFEVTNKECTLNGTSLTAKADLKNNSSQSQSYHFICAVYSAENEMLYAYESSGILSTGGTANINEQITVPDTAASAKLFIWNSADTMNTIYQ